MDQERKAGDRPVVVWEANGGKSEGEAVVRTIAIGQSGQADGPVIRIFSTGFGQQTAQAAAESSARMAA